MTVSVYLGFRIPARVKDAALVIQFNGVPHFTVQASPVDARGLLDEEDRRFLQAAKTLEAEGYQSNGHYLGEGPRAERLHRRRERPARWPAA